MSQENVELLRRAMEHFVRTGEPAWHVIHPDVEVYDHDILDAGDYRGHAGYARWLQDWGTAWETFTAEPVRYVDAGDLVVVELKIHATGGGSGIELERLDAIVFTVADGFTTRLDYFNNPAQAHAWVGDTQLPPRSGEDIVRSLVDVINGSDSVDTAMTALEGLMHPEIEYVNPEDAIEGGTRTGVAGIRTVLENFIAGAGAGATVEVEQVEERGDRVFSRGRVHARGASSGAEAVGAPTAAVYTIRDGRILRIEWDYDVDEARTRFEQHG